MAVVEKPAWDKAPVAPGSFSPPEDEPGEGIAFENVTVAYRGAIVLDDFSLNVSRGEIVALIGPSGCGKTTALRAIAGFIRPVAGRVKIGATDVTSVPPYARGIGMVVQNYALFPHMRVEDNVAFGLRAKGASRELTEKRVSLCLHLVGMSDFRRRYPRQLSGGQQQRVAIARALAIEPRVLLLDEPLSALDAQIRHNMVEEIAKLHRDLPALTILYVTHDQSEALTLADRIAIMRGGKLCALGPSQSLYRRPPNRFTAEFLGRANLLPIEIAGPAASETLAEVRFANAALRATANPTLRSGRAHLCVRPHAIRLSPAATVTDNRLVGTVRANSWQGDHSAITVECAGTEIRIVTSPLAEPPRLGDSLGFCFDPDDATILPEDHA
jgi:2-aminoethylphosphonate transport system ATP-binding protein